METKFLEQFKNLLPTTNIPVNFKEYGDVKVVFDDEIYFEIGQTIAKMNPCLQNWYDCLNEADQETIDEKLVDIFCEKYNLEF